MTNWLMPEKNRNEATSIIQDLCLKRGVLDRHVALGRLLALAGPPVIDLQWRWTELCRHYGVKEERAVIEWQAIQDAYCAPWRVYHTLDHIRDCLMELSSFEGGVEDRFAVEMAIWFHDFVYSRGADDNEFKSACQAEAFCARNGISMREAKNIEGMILSSTRKEEPSFFSGIYKDVKFFQDIDLSILGRSPEMFQAYEEKIQKEYSRVPARNFIEGRLKILTEFQNRKHIYETQIFRDKYEEQARVNIGKSINRLHRCLKAITGMGADPAVKPAVCESKAFVGWDDGGYGENCKLESGHPGPCVANIKVGSCKGGQAGGCEGTLVWSPKRKSDHA